MQQVEYKIAVKLVDDTLAKFTFEDEHTKISGNVSLMISDGRPDTRTKEERLRMAKQRILSLSNSFAQACAKQL